MAATTSYYSDYSSDESSDWSDDVPRTKRRRRSSAKSTLLSKNASAKGPIRKAKKPGRKPLETFDELPSDPKLKRKVQNRAAQRAFRERKEQFVVELQEQLKELEAAKEKREKELQTDIAKLKQENAKLKDMLKNNSFPSTDKSDPTSMVSSSPVVTSSPDEQMFIKQTSDLSDYQGSTPMTDSLSPDAAEHLFSSPVPYATNNFFQHDPLQSLFGTELDLFGDAIITPQELDPFFVEQMQAFTQQQQQQDATATIFPENEKPCNATTSSRRKILCLLNLAKGANRKISQFDNDLKAACPEDGIDQLCGELRKKISSEKNHIMTDEEVDLYIECIKQNS